jgi:hypothetical protein
MASSITIDLFAEDQAHEEFLRPLIYRVTREEDLVADVRVRSARGGHGRAIQEFSAYQRVILRTPSTTVFPDLVVVAIDGNCNSHSAAVNEINEKVKPEFASITVVACPDPHIERWYLADLDAFHEVVGSRPSLGKTKCKRDYYKQELSKAVIDAQHPPTLGGLEFAYEIVESLNYFKAGKADPSFHLFYGSLLAAVRRRAGEPDSGEIDRPIPEV